MIAAVVALAVGFVVLTVDLRRRREDARADAIFDRLGPYRNLQPALYVCAGAGCRGCATALAEHPGWERLRAAVDGGDA